MTIRIATQADMSSLIPLRMRLCFESGDGVSPPDVDAVEEENRLFFELHLNSPFSRTWIAEVHQEVVAIGTVAFFIPQSKQVESTGFQAFLLNVYTIAEHRRRGFASAIVAAAIAYCRSCGIAKVWLQATKEGQPLYAAAGFQVAGAITERKAA